MLLIILQPEREGARRWASQENWGLGQKISFKGFSQEPISFNYVPLPSLYQFLTTVQWTLNHLCLTHWWGQSFHDPNNSPKHPALNTGDQAFHTLTFETQSLSDYKRSLLLCFGLGFCCWLLFFFFCIFLLLAGMDSCMTKNDPIMVLQSLAFLRRRAQDTVQSHQTFLLDLGFLV